MPALFVTSILAAAPNSFERSVIAGDSDSAASAITGIATISWTVIVAIIMVAVTHAHAPNRGVNDHFCGRGDYRCGDCDCSNRQQPSEHAAHDTSPPICIIE